MAEEVEDDIGVAAESGKLRLWVAREAVRHGELRLAGQASNIQAMEAGATAVLQWSVGAMIGLLGFGAKGDLPMLPMAVAGCCLAAAMLISIRALWPKIWHHAGYSPQDLDDFGRNELWTLESIALGYDKSVLGNHATISAFGQRMRWAWCAFAAAPLLSAVAFGVMRYLGR